MTQGRKMERGGTNSGRGGVGLDPIGIPKLADICKIRERRPTKTSMSWLSPKLYTRIGQLAPTKTKVYQLTLTKAFQVSSKQDIAFECMSGS